MLASAELLVAESVVFELEAAGVNLTVDGFACAMADVRVLRVHDSKSRIPRSLFT